jgi:hypothetical protein
MPIGTCTAAAGIRSLERIWFTILQGFAPGLPSHEPLCIELVYDDIPIHFIDKGYPRNVISAHLTVYCCRLTLKGGVGPLVICN